MDSFASRVAARATKESPTHLLVTVLVFPFRLLGVIAAGVFVLLAFAWFAVVVGFTDVVGQVKFLRSRRATPSAGET